MTERFFHAENCNRFIKMDGFSFAFDPVNYIGGTWCGVYSTSDEKQVAALEKLCQTPRSAVREISREDFQKLTQKKTSISSGVLDLSALVNAEASPLIPQGAPPVGVPVNTEPPAPMPTVKPLDAVADALAVAPVAKAATSGCDLE
jgi:hypothetical protein